MREAAVATTALSESVQTSWQPCAPPPPTCSAIEYLQMPPHLIRSTLIAFYLSSCFFVHLFSHMPHTYLVLFFLCAGKRPCISQAYIYSIPCVDNSRITIGAHNMRTLCALLGSVHVRHCV